MENLEQRIQKVEERNKKVEIDKAWEISWTRRILLTFFTYLSVGVYLWAIGILNPWLNAIVPAAAFMISTLTMPFFKKLWLKIFHRSSSLVAILVLAVTLFGGVLEVRAHVPFGEYAGTHVVRFVPEPRSPFTGELVKMKFYLRDLRGFAPEEGVLVAVSIEEVFEDGREQQVFSAEPKGITEIGLYEMEYTFSKSGFYRIGYEFWEAAKPDAVREATFEMQVREAQERNGIEMILALVLAAALGFAVGRLWGRPV